MVAIASLMDLKDLARSLRTNPPPAEPPHEDLASLAKRQRPESSQPPAKQEEVKTSWRDSIIPSGAQVGFAGLPLWSRLSPLQPPHTLGNPAGGEGKNSSRFIQGVQLNLVTGNQPADDAESWGLALERQQMAATREGGDNQLATRATLYGIGAFYEWVPIIDPSTGGVWNDVMRLGGLFGPHFSLGAGGVHAATGFAWVNVDTELQRPDGVRVTRRDRPISFLPAYGRLSLEAVTIQYRAVRLRAGLSASWFAQLNNCFLGVRDCDLDTSFKMVEVQPRVMVEVLEF